MTYDYIGWLRPPGGCWEEHCRAATEREAWDVLLGSAVRGDKCVLPAGQDPNERARQGGFFG